MRLKMKNFFGAALILGFSVMPVMAQDFHAGNLVILDPWAPPSLGQQRIGAVYFSVRNQGQTPDRLQAIDLPDGGQAMLHNSVMQDGIMHMGMMDVLDIPAGGEAALEPGAMHVMLMDLPGPLLKGSKLRLILHFEKAGPVDVQAEIRPRPVNQTPPKMPERH